MAWSGEVHPGGVVLPRVVGMMGPKKREGIGQNVLGHRRQTDTALHTIYWGCCAGCVYISLEAHRGARIGTSLLAAAAPWLLCVFLCASFAVSFSDVSFRFTPVPSFKHTL